eukprot:scaffold43295_cov18-Prasinocladus_malaysianus.AAC.1
MSTGTAEYPYECYSSSYVSKPPCCRIRVHPYFFERSIDRRNCIDHAISHIELGLSDKHRRSQSLL